MTWNAASSRLHGAMECSILTAFLFPHNAAAMVSTDLCASLLSIDASSSSLDPMRCFFLSSRLQFFSFASNAILPLLSSFSSCCTASSPCAIRLALATPVAFALVVLLLIALVVFALVALVMMCEKNYHARRVLVSCSLQCKSYVVPLLRPPLLSHESSLLSSFAMRLLCMLHLAAIGCSLTLCSLDSVDACHLADWSVS